MLADGSWNARLSTAAITKAPATSSQETRWPSRPSSGMRTPSTTPAPRNSGVQTRKASGSGGARAPPAQPRDAHAVHDPSPEELEVIDQKGERERGHGRLGDPLLRQPRGQGR